MLSSPAAKRSRLTSRQQEWHHILSKVADERKDVVKEALQSMMHSQESLPGMKYQLFMTCKSDYYEVENIDWDKFKELCVGDEEDSDDDGDDHVTVAEVNCTVFFIGNPPWKHTMKLPNTKQIKKGTVKDKWQDLPSLPSGLFVLVTIYNDDKDTEHGIVIFKHLNRAKCSETTSKKHASLPATPQMTSLYQNLKCPYVNIGAGSAYFGSELAVNDNQDGTLAITTERDPISESPTMLRYDLHEEKRRKYMVAALYMYIQKHNLNITVTDNVEVDGSEYCRFSGGGDIFLIGNNLTSAVVLVLNEESNEETKVFLSFAIETKVQALAFEKIVQQLQANMLVCSTTRFCKLTKCNPSVAEGIHGLKTYGLVVGHGQPIYLLSSYMDFKSNRLDYNIEMQFSWGPLAAIHLDRAFNYLIKKITE